MHVLSSFSAVDSKVRLEANEGLDFRCKARANTLFAEAVVFVGIDYHSTILLLFQLLVLKYVINKDVFMRYVNQSYSVVF